MKPAQKLKGARLEAGQTQERDDASLLAHREESKDAVKSRRAFLRFVLVTVYLVVWGGVCSCVLDGRQNGCNGVLAGGVLCRSPVEHAGAVLFHRMRPGVGRLQTDNAVLFWSDEHAGALCDVQPERYGLVSKIQSAGAVRLSARIAVRGCRYGGGCGSAGCQKETGKAVEPPCPRYPGMKKPQRQQALRLHVLLCSQCNLRFWKHLGYTPRFKTAWVLVPFPYFRNTGFCISYF